MPHFTQKIGEFLKFKQKAINFYYGFRFDVLNAALNTSNALSLVRAWSMMGFGYLCTIKRVFAP